ncbi:class I SAM-dependent methyltransferase [Streptomyces sp. NPDC016469]|uniref:class I SAM-dependent methyltransferase n=1 Tax=Streptomyces sp. NPDC016469 TaxID=3157191 RepID=UPI00340B97A8
MDASPAQHYLATAMYGTLSPRLRLVHRDVIPHLDAHPATHDVLYSTFGAVDFTDPGTLLPAAAGALRPGGRLAFSEGLLTFLERKLFRWKPAADEDH